MDVVPVRLDSSELYGILRSKLFEKLPGEAERRAVGQEYAAALRTAVQQGAVPGSYERWAQEVAASYPFHPGLHELFARFRENKDFQQTRETLRLAQRMVAGAWPGTPALADSEHAAASAHGRSRGRGHGLDLRAHQPVAQQRPRARHRDSRRLRRRAEDLAPDLGDPTAADAAKLIFLSSLAVGPNALQGLTPGGRGGLSCRAGSRRVVGERGVDDPAGGGQLVPAPPDGRALALPQRQERHLGHPRSRRDDEQDEPGVKEVENYLRTTFEPARTTPQRRRRPSTPTRSCWCSRRRPMFARP